MIQSNLDVMVKQAWDNCRDNNYTFPNAYELAFDMCMYDSDLENFEVDEVQASIIKQGIMPA